ncbi:recombinase family protein [Saccharibacillus sp. O23]|uniref:recombinase family protein n=1 Tax=Saccharibacillus sp. O23 TaxID=2009338 RepID=UPI00211AEEBC|nr:recombinase family protein [Saccharibacillus sp. O23]
MEKEWTITHQFIEKGRSAKTDERPEFQKMIALAKRSNRPFDAIVVHKFDRFSRKRDDHVIYKALLNQHEAKVLSVTEQIQAETPQDMLLEGMLEVISEFLMRTWLSKFVRGRHRARSRATTVTTKKYGGQRYYVCGGYMRKGKEFCPYVSWRKERIEQTVTNKLRSVLLRLTFDNQLEEEIRKYHSDANRHIWTEKANLESEFAYLGRRISQLEEELKSGVGKVCYVDMLEDLKGEFVVKQAELEKIRDAYSELDLSEETLKSLMHDIRVMIGMLDDEIQNPQLMNEYVKKFVSEVTVHREKKTCVYKS